MKTPEERLAFIGCGEGHSTALAGLHPNLQANFAEAQSVMSRALSLMHGHSLHDLGITNLTEGVADAYFAAIDRTGAKAQALGYTPRVVYLGDRVDLYEVPSPLIVSLGSTTSPSAALVWVTFLSVNDFGYGDWATADGGVVGIYATLDQAHDQLAEIAKAYRVLTTVARKTGMVDQDKPMRALPAF